MSPVLRWLRDNYSFALVPRRKLPKANLCACLTHIAALGLQPRHIIDVGANKGNWSRVARRVFPDAAFTLLEPQVEMAGYLDRFCRGKNARWLLAGASDEAGELLLTVNPDTVSSTFVLSADEARRSGLKQRVVPVVTLDQLVEQGPTIPEIVKIDAEGFEAKIVRGASKLIGITEVFFVEAHMLEPGDHPCGFVELVALMADLGYVPFDFTWFGRLRGRLAIDLCEVAFARRGGILRTRAIA